MTANFNPIYDVKLLCTCGHAMCDKRSVGQHVLDRLQLIREDYAKPIIITSGGRCPYHTDEVKKAEPGDHQKCFAVDVKCDSALDETKLKVLAGRYGATRVAGCWRDGFIHLAWTPTERKDVPTWEY